MGSTYRDQSRKGLRIRVGGGGDEGCYGLRGISCQNCLDAHCKILLLTFFKRREGVYREGVMF